MYDLIIWPLVAGLIAQAAKLFIRANGQKFSFKNITAYSGMPSGHSAIVMSLITIIALKEGMTSPAFAVSAVLALIVIRDALGLRRYLGEHGKLLNSLVKDLNDDQMLNEKYPTVLEKIGHTAPQVVVGSLIGIIVSFIGCYI